MQEDDDKPEEDAENQNPDADSEESADESEGEGGGGFNARKIILFVILPIVILAGVGGGLYFSGMLDSYLKPATEEEATKEAEKAEKEEPKEAVFVEIPTIIVNLSSDPETSRFLRLSVQLEVNGPEDAEAVRAVIPRVIDQFQTYLRELRVEDLRGSAGIYRLQMELLWRVNQAAAPVQVEDVLFQEILIQ